MPGHQEPLPKNIRGLVIGLLVLSILNWPWPIWNAVYGFVNTIFFYYRRARYSFVTLASLSTVFGVVTSIHAAFALVKIVIFSLDLDRKLSAKERLGFINWYLIIETAIFVLTIAFGLASTLYGFYDTDTYFSFWNMSWILIGITAALQLISFPLALKLRSWAKAHADDDDDNGRRDSYALGKTESQRTLRHSQS